MGGLVPVLIMKWIHVLTDIDIPKYSPFEIVFPFDTRLGNITHSFSLDD